jgi:hypothetical protein
LEVAEEGPLLQHSQSEFSVFVIDLNGTESHEVDVVNPFLHIDHDSLSLEHLVLKVAEHLVHEVILSKDAELVVVEEELIVVLLLLHDCLNDALFQDWRQFLIELVISQCHLRRVVQRVLHYIQILIKELVRKIILVNFFIFPLVICEAQDVSELTYTNRQELVDRLDVLQTDETLRE